MRETSDGWNDGEDYRGRRGVFEGYLALPGAGSGPGLILAQEIFGINRHMREVADLYAEEGYVVLAPDLFWRLAAGVELGYEAVDLETAFSFHERFGIDQGVHDINDAIRALRARPECNGRVAVLGFGLGGRLAYLAAARLKIDAAVSYYGMELEQHLEEARSVHCPIVFHFGEQDGYTPPAVSAAVRKAFAGRQDAEIYVYPGADHGFNNPARGNFNKSAATLAHSRTIGLLHRAIGPRYDLEALWEKHVECEFATRSVDETMKTMVAEPYVNHVPDMTGGYGYRELYRFYKNHFIPKVPKDTKIIPVSRTVGANTLVDEFIFCCTHDVEIDFMLPGIPPTGKYLEIPHIAVVHFRGDKIAHEHIYWEQATALAQLGLLDPKGLPVAGVQTAKKVLDPSLPSNTLMAAWAKSEPEKK
ncbi:MAG TPA: dienelactone hydrolase family protein [Candidatus Binataceae bacterium]|jgi:carboxymethylenebutenolidase|nr:dienelactone hydrolase family protein [Candidatus Binataceae bacterium]